MSQFVATLIKHPRPRVVIVTALENELGSACRDILLLRTVSKPSEPGANAISIAAHQDAFKRKD